MMSNKVNLLYLYPIVMVTGAAVLVLEILGTRVVAPFYGSTIFVWTSQIIVTLCAIALGYFLGGKLIDRKPAIKTLSSIVALAGLFFFVPMKIHQWVLPVFDTLDVRFGPLAAAAALFFLPLFLLGMICPMVIRLLTKKLDTSGSISGSVFALSTLGSVVGSLLAGYFLLPLYSISQIFNATGLFLLIIGAAGIWIDKNKGRMSINLFIFAFIGSVLVLRTPYYQHTDTYTYKLYHQERSHYGDLKIMSVGGNYCLTLNGFTQSCKDTFQTATFGNVEAMAGLVNQTFMKQGQPDSFRVLVLGAGGGDMPQFISENIQTDIIEIDPKVIELAQKYYDFKPNPTHQVIIADGRHYLRKTNNLYDFILFDAYAGGAIPAHFLSLEAFQLFRDRLKPQGVLVMNIAGRPSHDDLLVSSLVQTSKKIYPHVAIYAPYPKKPETQQGMILVGTRENNFSVAWEWYLPIDISGPEFQKGKVLTDDYLPVEVLAADTLASFRKNMIIFGGYKPFFSL